MDAHGKMLEIRKLIDESYGLIPESEPVRWKWMGILGWPVRNPDYWRSWEDEAQ